MKIDFEKHLPEAQYPKWFYLRQTVWTVSGYYYYSRTHPFFICNVGYVNFFTFDKDDMKRHVIYYTIYNILVNS